MIVTRSNWAPLYTDTCEENNADAIKDINERLISIGDLNGRVGKKDKETAEVIGILGENINNNNGVNLNKFCIMNKLMIMNTSSHTKPYTNCIQEEIGQ